MATNRIHSTTPRRDFLLRLGVGAAALGAVCPLLAQTAAPPPAADAPKPPPAESGEVARLRRQLQAQREGSTRLLAELHAKLGAPVIEVISADTVARAQADFEKRPVNGSRDLHALRAELWDKLPPTFIWEVLEDTPGRMRFRVTKCPIVEDMKRFNDPELGYALACASDPGIAAGINPKIRFTRTQTLMQGGACCDHAYKLAE
jgi:hypothetical protein